jgi:hypothetical protein
MEGIITFGTFRVYVAAPNAAIRGDNLSRDRGGGRSTTANVMVSATASEARAGFSVAKNDFSILFLSENRPIAGGGLRRKR